MFKKGDWFFLAAWIIFIVLTAAAVIASVVWPIAVAITFRNGLFALIIIPCLVGCFVFLVLWNLLLSYLCDIKLVRNKLYGQRNDNLGVYVDTSIEVRERLQKIRQEDPLTTLQRLEQMLEKEMITPEYYEERRRTVMLQDLQQMFDGSMITSGFYEECKKRIESLG